MENKIDRNKIIDTLANEMRFHFNRKYSDKCKEHQRVTLYNSYLRSGQNVNNETITEIKKRLEENGYTDVTVWLRKTNLSEGYERCPGVSVGKYVSIVFKFPHGRYFSNRGRK